MLVDGSWVIGAPSGDLRVLREMPHHIQDVFGEPGTNEGVAVDLETTGLDPETDEVIALGYVKFGFDDSMRITHVIEAKQFFNEPSKEIPEEITKLTGITQEMVKGHKLTQEIWDHVFLGTEIAIAHNAKFDRKFVDRFYDSKIIWGCSNADLDSRGKYNVPSGSLGVLMAYVLDYYFGHHDALEDCWALTHFLNVDDHFKQIVEKTFTKSWNVYARNSPFEMKDILKKRGYRWSGDMKMWFYPSADGDKKTEELEFLSEHRICGEEMEISTYDRHLEN